MPPMPFVVTQGQVLTALENAFNYGHTDRQGVFRSAKQVRLDTLRDHKRNPPTTVGRAGGILSLDVDAHMEAHWFGGPGGPATQPPGPTGWWVNWRGPARDIARQGMIVALEVALGINHGDPVPANDAAVEMNPMDFSWICPVPRFEFWVSSRNWHGPPPPSPHPLPGGVVQADSPAVIDKCTPVKIVCVTFATPGYKESPDWPALTSKLGRPQIGSGNHVDPADQIAADPAYRPNEHIVIGADLSGPCVRPRIATAYRATVPPIRIRRSRQ